MSFSEFVYRRINGGFFIIFGTLVSFLFVTVAWIFYIAVDPSFSVFTHWMSDLGVGPNGSDIIHNTGLYYSSFFTIFSCLYLSFYLEQKGGIKLFNLIALIPAIISAIGVFFLAVFPIAPGFGPHNIAAGTFFGGIFAFSLAYGIAEYLNPKISKWFSVSSFISAFFILLYLILCIGPFPVVLAFFSEWLTLVGIGIWVSIHGILIMRDKSARGSG